MGHRRLDRPIASVVALEGGRAAAGLAGGCLVIGDLSGLAREPHLFAPKSDAARARFAAILKANRGNLTAGNGMLTGPVAWPKLGEITAPTLIITGEADMPDLHAESGALAALIPGARRIIMSDTGHYPYMERPQPFLKEVTRFLDQDAKPATAGSAG